MNGTQENTVPAERRVITREVLAARVQIIDQNGIEVRLVSQAFELIQSLR